MLWNNNLRSNVTPRCLVGKVPNSWKIRWGQKSDLLESECFFFFASDMHDILVAIWGLTPNQSMCEISQWFSMADSLKILKHLALGHFSHYPLMSEHPLWQKRSRKGVERLILNHDTIPYLRMKRNFIHTYCTLVWGTVINLGLAFRIGWQFPNPSLLLFWFVYCEKKNQCSFCLLW